MNETVFGSLLGVSRQRQLQARTPHPLSRLRAPRHHPEGGGRGSVTVSHELRQLNSASSALAMAVPEDQLRVK